MTDIRKSRLIEQQIIGFIEQAEAGLPIKDLCRKGGFSDATFYKWHAKYGAMDVPDARWLRELWVLRPGVPAQPLFPDSTAPHASAGRARFPADNHRIGRGEHRGRKAHDPYGRTSHTGAWTGGLAATSSSSGDCCVLLACRRSVRKELLHRKRSFNLPHCDITVTRHF